MQRGTEAARPQAAWLRRATWILGFAALFASFRGTARGDGESGQASAAAPSETERAGDAALARANQAMGKRRLGEARKDALKARAFYRESDSLNKELEALVLLGQIETDANNTRLAVHYIAQARKLLEREQSGRTSLRPSSGLVAAGSERKPGDESKPAGEPPVPRTNEGAAAQKPGDASPPSKTSPDAGVLPPPRSRTAEGSPAKTPPRTNRPEWDAGFRNPLAKGQADAGATPARARGALAWDQTPEALVAPVHSPTIPGDAGLQALTKPEPAPPAAEEADVEVTNEPPGDVVAPVESARGPDSPVTAVAAVASPPHPTSSGMGSLWLALGAAGVLTVLATALAWRRHKRRR